MSGVIFKISTDSNGTGFSQSEHACWCVPAPCEPRVGLWRVTGASLGSKNYLLCTGAASEMEGDMNLIPRLRFLLRKGWWSLSELAWDGASFLQVLDISIISQVGLLLRGLITNLTCSKRSLWGFIFNPFQWKASFSSNVIWQAQNVGCLCSYQWEIFIFLLTFSTVPHPVTKEGGFHWLEWEETFANWDLSWQWIEGMSLYLSGAQFPHLSL